MEIKSFFLWQRKCSSELIDSPQDGRKYLPTILQRATIQNLQKNAIKYQGFKEICQSTNRFTIHSHLENKNYK